MSISSQNAFSPSNASHFCELRGEFPHLYWGISLSASRSFPMSFLQAFLEQNASEIYLSHSALILSSAYAFLPTKKRAEPAFTSAEVCHASKSCSRGRFCAISYMSKKRVEPAFTSAEACHASKSCSRGRFCAISYMSKKHIHPDAERTQRRRPMDVLLIRQASLKLTERFSFRKATPFGKSAVLSLCGFIHPSLQGRR